MSLRIPLRVSLVDDDQPAAESLRDDLTLYGHKVEWVRTGHDALLIGPLSDFVLLARSLPDMDGIDVCRELRAVSDVPIIMFTPCAEGADRIVCLEMGADDCVTVPVGSREVHSRMRAILRRARVPDTTAPASAPAPAQRGHPGHGRHGLGREGRDGLGRLGRLSIDRRAHRVFLDGDDGAREVALTPREYALLAFLAEEPGALMTREEIMRAVWDSHWFGSTKTLDAHIAALRRKLGEALAIETVRGVGFRMAAKP